MNNFYNHGQSLIGIIIVLVVVGLISGGLYYYLSKQIPEIPEIVEKPAEEVPPPEEEVVPPKEEIPPEEVKPEIICQDECSPRGLKRCSNNGYQICGNYDKDPCLEWNAVISCPSNTICQNGNCIQQKCADGTLYSQCSTNKPKYCDNGNLINKASFCGCPFNYEISNNQCVIKIPYQIAVLNLSYIPIKDGMVDINLTGDWRNPDLIATRKNIQDLTQQLVDALNKGSIYQGYKNPSATPSLNYKIFENKEFLGPIPLAYLTYPSPANHQKILSELNICDYIENKGVKEVWIWMYHTDKVYVVESYLTGPFASFGNGYMDLPKCKKSYTVYDFNYGRSVAMALENHTHQIEHVLNYIDGRDTTLQENWSSLLFWGKFVGSDKSHKIISPGCGWTHFPPNGEKDYDWYNEKQMLSDCENWKPDSTGEKKLINCHTWAGSVCEYDEGLSFKIWWMQNIPGKNNNLIYEGKKLKNWWEFIGNFDQAMQDGKSLTY